jgi:hypothetical protein
VSGVACKWWECIRIAINILINRNVPIISNPAKVDEGDKGRDDERKVSNIYTEEKSKQYGREK